MAPKGTPFFFTRASPRSTLQQQQSSTTTGEAHHLVHTFLVLHMHVSPHRPKLNGHCPGIGRRSAMLSSPRGVSK